MKALAERFRILSVVGARPNFMKVAPLHRAFQRHLERVDHRIVHTGQHYDAAMSKVFFEELELPKPDFYLGAGSDTHARQTAKIMVEFETVLNEFKPHLVIVVGDVNSTVACSLVAVKQNTPVAHVEAGLRSFDRTMPEEINRLVTDAIAELLFVSEPSGVANLRKEGVAEERIKLVGNTMIDTLITYEAKAARSEILKQTGVNDRDYALVTLHRPTNVDEQVNLDKVLTIFEKISGTMSIVFPVHPRTRKMFSHFGFDHRIEQQKKIVFTDPLGYLDFLRLTKNAKMVITDSGGIQEETTYLGVPCLTLRSSTERPVTIEIGTNELCPLDVDLIAAKAMDIAAGRWKKGRVPELWDGRASERIVQEILAWTR